MPGPVALISSILLAIVALAAYGLPGLFQLTHSLLDFCRSVFVFCTGYLDVAKLVVLWTGFGLVSAGIVYGIVKALRGLINSHLAVSRLPRYDKGTSVVLIKDKGLKTAFTHGLVRPRVYISTGLIESLEREELKAVFSHELHHKKRRDPLRFFLLTFLKDAFFYLPAIKEYARRVRQMAEHDADDAVRGEYERLQLAGALVKASSFNRAALAHASITGTDPVAGRVRRLVEGKEVRFGRLPFRSFALSLTMAVLIAVSIVIPVTSKAMAECTTDHCAAHMSQLGDSCKTHCSVDKTHKHH